MFASIKEGVVQLTVKLEENGVPLINQEVRILKAVRFTSPIYGTADFDLSQETGLYVIEVPGKDVTLPPKGIIYMNTVKNNQILVVTVGPLKEQKAFQDVDQKINTLLVNVNNLDEFIRKSKSILEDYFSQNNIELEQYKIVQFLEFQKEKQFIIEGQLKTIPLLTKDLDQYISRTKDLADVTEKNKEKVFNDSGRIINKINQSIDGYNEAYEELNRNRETILNLIGTYWGEGTVFVETQSLLGEALQNLHQLEILIADNLLEDISNFNEKRKGRRAKVEIEKDLTNTIARIRIRTENLDKDKTRIVQKLKEFYKPAS